MIGAAQARRAAASDLWARLRARPGVPFVVAGTNVVTEREDDLLAVASRVAEIGARLHVPVVFKASWDKANRTAANAYRGRGMRQGLDLLARVRREFNLPVLTDVHEVHQVQPVAQVADILQIPSFLCRQTDLIAAAAGTGRIVNLKRGQFASASVMAHAVSKAKQLGGAEQVMVCERGLMFGLDDLVFDPRQVAELQRACGPEVPVLVDVTHACQSPPSRDMHASSGSRAMVPLVARAAAAAGADGIFIECHPDPDRAPVDSAVQLHVDDLEPLLCDVLAIAEITLRASTRQPATVSGQ